MTDTGDTILEDQESVLDSNQQWVLDDELWERLLELTDGAAAPCFQCGVCTATCPWGLVRGEPLSVRSLMRRAQVGYYDPQDPLWLCTACGACEELCPRGVPIIETIRVLRLLLWERRDTLKGLPSVLWSEYWNNNPLFQPPSERVLWAKDLDLPIFQRETHELLLYVGCTPAYDRRAQRIARALVRILQAAEVSFGILGEKEPCCGEVVLNLGHQPYFAELAEGAAGVFKEEQVTNLISISPHCQDVFQSHYPDCGKGFKPSHYLSYLISLVEQDRLNFTKGFNHKVTVHDPCLLSRKADETQAIRTLLTRIPGIELIEMAHNMGDTLCCGGGGGRMWMETPAEERFADLRLKEAVQTDATILATACPYCVACLEDGAKNLGMADLQILDVAEILAGAI